MINYEDLLRRYMKFVEEEEGVNFVYDRPFFKSGWNDVEFTPEEWSELQRLNGIELPDKA